MVEDYQKFRVVFCVCWAGLSPHFGGLGFFVLNCNIWIFRPSGNVLGRHFPEFYLFYL